MEELMMGAMEKIANAKKTSWISEGISEVEIKTTVELARISAKIERCRLDLGMTQIEFARFMGVTQGMVSKWESRDYNFTVRSLNEICQKLDLILSVSIEKPCLKNDYIVIKWEEEKIKYNRKKKNWVGNLKNKEAIA